MICQYCDKYTEIVDLLVSDLFTKDLEDILVQRYERMIQLRDASHTDEHWEQDGCRIIRQKDVLLEVDIPNIPSLNNYSDLGHDLPYWIEAGNKKRVMFVSQDPLRSKKKSGFITFSSPFGIHSKDYREKKLITRIVENLIGKSYSVYLTDFHKLYATEGDKGDKKVSFSDYYDPRAILAEEIKIFKPTIIVTIGKLAKDELIQMDDIREDIEIQHIPHPNAAINCLDTDDLRSLLQLLE